VLASAERMCITFEVINAAVCAVPKASGRWTFCSKARGPIEQDAQGVFRFNEMAAFTLTTAEIDEVLGGITGLIRNGLTSCWCSITRATGAWAK
jgi:hypothetical protein